MDILARRVAKRHTSISSSKKFPIHSLLSLGIIGLLTLVFFFSSFIGMRQEAHALSNGVALTPPMGWSSWNAHFANINASVIRTAADAVVNSGMQAAGYQYINTDEGWWTGSRDSSGNITVNTSNWPGGMQALASYIHSKGLKAGIYTDAGINGCGGTNQGSYGHYDQDMLQFEQWGFDYVKVDWCGGRDMGLDPATQYGQIRDAIAKATAQTGHPMVFNICVWGVNSPWNWGPSTGNSWRTSTDISFSLNSATWSGVLGNFDAAQHPSAQTVGAYNDPDMMEVGVPGLSTTESQSHFSLWAISGAPLLAGNDITTMSSTTRDILTNSEVIAVDQDPLDKQGTLVSQPASGLQVYSKVLSVSGQRAVALLNRTNSTANITVNWSNIGLPSTSASVRDLWAHTNVGSFTNSYTASVPSHGVVMLKISTGNSSTPTPIPTVTSTPTPVPTVTPTPTPTSMPTPTPTPTSSMSCQVGYSVNQWSGGFTANITITNTSTTTINGWTLKFTFPGNQQITQGWNGAFSQSGANVTIANLNYNGTIGANGSANPGFNGSWSGSNPNPMAFTLNGVACRVA